MRIIPDSLLPDLLQKWRDGWRESDFCSYLGTDIKRWTRFKIRHRKEFELANAEHRASFKRNREIAATKRSRNQMCYADHLKKRGVVVNKWML